MTRSFSGQMGQKCSARNTMLGTEHTTITHCCCLRSILGASTCSIRLHNLSPVCCCILVMLWEFNPFPHIDAFWRLCLRQLFENQVTKEEIAQNVQFLLLLQCFPLFVIVTHSIMEISYVLTKYVQSRLLQNCRMRERVNQPFFYQLYSKIILCMVTDWSGSALFANKRSFANISDTIFCNYRISSAISLLRP